MAGKGKGLTLKKKVEEPPRKEGSYRGPPGDEEIETPSPPLRRKAPLGGVKVPDVINPDTIVDLKDIPSLFKTIHRMMTSLTDLNCEYKLRLPDGQEFWLVPSYSDGLDRNEISFQDASTMTVVCAVFSGTVKAFKFLTPEKKEKDQTLEVPVMEDPPFVGSSQRIVGEYPEDPEEPEEISHVSLDKIVPYEDIGLQKSPPIKGDLEDIVEVSGDKPILKNNDASHVDPDLLERSAQEFEKEKESLPPEDHPREEPEDHLEEEEDIGPHIEPSENRIRNEPILPFPRLK